MAYRKQNNRNKVLDIVLGIVAVVVLVLATLFTLEVTGTVDFKGIVDDVTEKVENLFEKEEVEESNVLSFEIEFGGMTGTIEYEEGMTWAEWLESDYNVHLASINDSDEGKLYVSLYGLLLCVDDTYVNTTDLIDGSLNYNFGDIGVE